MNREQAKELLPIIQAFVAGEAIEVRNKSKYEPGEWIETTIPSFDIVSHEYRIKPKPKYRPFANAEECWQEMQKHQPFGWVRGNSSGYYKHINNLFTNNISFQETEIAASGNFEWSLSDLFKSYTFADGTPFGIKE